MQNQYITHKNDYMQLKCQCGGKNKERERKDKI
jgi:hypothetical protein